MAVMMRSLAILAIVTLARSALAQPAPAPAPGQPPASAPGQPPAPPSAPGQPGPVPGQPAPAPEQQPAPPPSVIVTDPALALRHANDAAAAGDWALVHAYVMPLLSRQLGRPDLAEAHRLAGIAALFAQPRNAQLAEYHFLEYLRIDPDAHLDPALYPPEVVNHFNDVRARHAAELKALRPKKRYAILAVLPPFAQFQNGDRVKGYVLGSLIGAFAITNVTTYLVLRSWCFKQTGTSGSSAGCDENNDTARTLRGLNFTSFAGLLVTYVYGVYDGVRGYRRETRERTLVPYASPTNSGAVFGVHLEF